jgi:hypothetical protein
MKKKSEQKIPQDFSYTKTYKSKFVPELDVDISNYLTEILISRNWKYKGNKVPPLAFWTKEHKDNYKELVTDYVYELTQVKKILKVFSPGVVLSYLKNNEISSLRYIKKEDFKDMLFGLFKDQLSFLNTLEEISKTEIENEQDKIEYIARKTQKTDNLFAKGL